jgi:hypothetical protein
MAERIKLSTASKIIQKEQFRIEQLMKAQAVKYAETNSIENLHQFNKFKLAVEELKELKSTEYNLQKRIDFWLNERSFSAIEYALNENKGDRLNFKKAHYLVETLKGIKSLICLKVKTA